MNEKPTTTVGELTERLGEYPPGMIIENWDIASPSLGRTRKYFSRVNHLVRQLEKYPKSAVINRFSITLIDKRQYLTKIELNYE